MSTKDEALIDKMLEEYFKKINRTFSGGQREVVVDNMRRALAVARKAILEEAAELAKQFPETPEGAFGGNMMIACRSTSKNIAAEILALADQEAA